MRIKTLLLFLQPINTKVTGCKAAPHCWSSALTLMRTSLASGGATSISSITKGFLVSQATAALHRMTWKAALPQLDANCKVLKTTLFESITTQYNLPKKHNKKKNLHWGKVGEILKPYGKSHPRGVVLPKLEEPKDDNKCCYTTRSQEGSPGIL